MSTASRASGWSLHLVDVFVYLVVLGLFTQFFPRVLSESFAVSLATAIVLKLVLEAVVAIKSPLMARVRATRGTVTPRARVVATAALVLTGAGSKFVVLWLTDVLLGDAVSLGGFFQVTLLVVTLIAARAAVRRILSPEPVDIA